MEFHLMRPEWLWTLLPAAVLTLLLWQLRQNRGGWQSVIAPELLQYLVNEGSLARGRNLLPWILLGWVTAALAASGPSWQKIPLPVHQKQDALVVLLDLSYSMKSGDLAPSRLDRARQKLLDLLQQRREGQTALVAYAGDAHIVTPLTDDMPTIANLLPALNPDMMPLRGSNPVDAAAMAVDLLHSAGIRQGKILLVTDGVTSKDIDKIEAALANSDHRLSVMGVGTPTGAPIPLPQGGFLRDNSGAIVMPSLEESGLRTLARATGGSYRRIQIDDSDLATLLSDKVLDGAQESLALDRSADTWEDQGYLLILLLLPLALALFRRGWVLALMPCVFVVPPQPAHAQSWSDLWYTPDQQAQRALQQGDNETAAALFENHDWAGTAAYRGGDFEGATEHFSDTQNADRLYNRGNALARSGLLEEAIESYKQSLELAPGMADAEANLALLEELKKQQEQQQQQNQQQDQQDQDQEQQDQQKQQEQQIQEQQGQEQQDQQGQQQEGGQQQEREQQSGEQDSEQQQKQEQQSAEQEPGQEQQEPRESPSQPGDEETGDEQVQRGRAEAGDAEKDQAMEQWLRRIPDDPSGLLREKFRYESEQRQKQGANRGNETVW